VPCLPVVVAIRYSSTFLGDHHRIFKSLALSIPFLQEKGGYGCGGGGGGGVGICGGGCEGGEG
jgi:hypothetical protein